MKDEFLQYFSWITDLFKRPTSEIFNAETEEYVIMERLKDGWGKGDTAGLLKKLTAEYGDKAGQTMEKYLELILLKDWAETGRKEGHDGTEIEDFIRLLWDPLKEQGFEYTMSRKDGHTKFTVTKCPIHQLAEMTGMHEWLYHLACSTDPHSCRGFCSKIGFIRTKELIKGDDCCNHEYFYIEEA